MQHPQSGAHHQRIGLAAEIRLLAGSHFNGRYQGAAGRSDAVFDGAGHIGIGADQLRARHHQIGGLGQGIQRVGTALAHHHIVGIHIVHGDARVIQGVQQSRLSDGEHGASGSLFLQECRRGQRTGVEMLLRHIQPHTGQLLIQLTGRIAAVVGEEKILLILVMKPLDELRHTGQDSVAVIDDAVHIADKAFFCVEIHRSKWFHRYDPALHLKLVRLLYHAAQ